MKKEIARGEKKSLKVKRTHRHQHHHDDCHQIKY